MQIQARKELYPVWGHTGSPDSDHSQRAIMAVGWACYMQIQARKGLYPVWGHYGSPDSDHSQRAIMAVGWLVKCKFKREGGPVSGLGTLWIT